MTAYDRGVFAFAWTILTLGVALCTLAISPWFPIWVCLAMVALAVAMWLVVKWRCRANRA